jgi:rhamnosyl/mannosyltransferase
MVVRVLHAYKSYHPDVTGGVAQVIEQILACTQDFENRVLVARSRGRGRLTMESGTCIEAVSSFGELWSLPIAPGYPLALTRLMARADLLVQHAPFPLADLGLLFARADRPKLVVYWHADIVRTGCAVRAAAALSERTLRRADRIVVSHDSIARNSPVLRRYMDKRVVIPFSVDLAYWSELTHAQTLSTDSLRKQYPRLILAVGRLVPYKGFEVLVEAMRSVAGQLIIVGTGPLRKSLEDKIRLYGLESKVRLVGHLARDEVKVHLQAARAFAFPSLTAAEAFGLVQLEAMATGLPIVNTRLPTAVPHIARHDLEALTVDPGNAPDLALALNRLLDDTRLAARLGQAGRARAELEYSPELFAERTRKLLKEVLQPGTGPDA